MTVTKRTTGDKIIWLLTVVLMSSFYLFERYAWGRYLLAVIAVLIIIVHIAENGTVIQVRFGAYHAWLLAMAAYSLLSALWALSRGSAVAMCGTFLSQLACFSLVYLHYQTRDGVGDLLLAIKWAGYFVAVYSIVFYGGFSAITMAAGSASNRLENAYSNVNAISMLVAVACILQAHGLLNRGRKWPALLLVPSLAVVAAMQSRKAVVLLIIGVVAVLVTHFWDNRNALRTLLRILLIAIAAGAMLWYLSTLEIFEGSIQRLVRMITVLTGGDAPDGSTRLRMEMIRVGLTQFLKTPVFGIGIGSSGVLLEEEIGRSTYMHNNYVELLSCGGLVGFLLYYSMYAYLLVRLIRYRRYDTQNVQICVILLLCLLIMDVGAVSYYSKNQWFYMMVMFLEVAGVQNKHMEDVQIWQGC